MLTLEPVLFSVKYVAAAAIKSIKVQTVDIVFETFVALINDGTV